MKKCKKCGAPLEGFLYNTIGKLMGIKPSDADPEVCNKCAVEKTEEDSGTESSAAEQSAPEVSTEPVAPEVESTPESAPVSEEQKSAVPSESSAEAEEEKKEEPTV